MIHILQMTTYPHYTYIQNLNVHLGNKWHVFTGNEIGVLLGYWQIQKWKKSLVTCSASTKVSPTQQIGTGYAEVFLNLLRYRMYSQHF